MWHDFWKVHWKGKSLVFKEIKCLYSLILRCFSEKQRKPTKWPLTFIFGDKISTHVIFKMYLNSFASSRSLPMKEFYTSLRKINCDSLPMFIRFMGDWRFFLYAYCLYLHWGKYQNQNLLTIFYWLLILIENINQTNHNRLWYLQ